MSSISDAASKLAGFPVPPLPCGLDAEIEGLKSEIQNAINSVMASYAPGSLISNLSSLETILKDKITTAIGTQLANALPGFVPASFVEDVFALGKACSLGASPECTALLSSITEKYTSLGSAENITNIILSALGKSQADICKALPNIKIGINGDQTKGGLAGKIFNGIGQVAALPDQLASLASVKADRLLNPLSQRKST